MLQHTLYRHKNTSINVGIEIAIYSSDQLFTRLYNPGNNIKPIDQNCSKHVVIMTRGFPLVMSVTAFVKLIN